MNERFVGDDRYVGEDLRDLPIGELLKRLSAETTDLLRKELELAKVELVEKGKTAGSGAGMFGVAGALGLGAFGALTAALIMLLGLAVAPWIGALIVAVVYGAVAYLMMQRGKAKFEEVATPVPEETLQSVKEDVAWAKTQIKSSGK